MPSGAPPHVALEGEPVDEGLFSHTVESGSNSLAPHSRNTALRWEFTVVLLGPGPEVSEGITHEEWGPNEKQGELY